MEKFQKYCLSVLLVIICSNISAQVINGSVENEDCRQLYEFYHQILNHGGKTSEGFCPKASQTVRLAINKKQKAVDLIGKIFCVKTQNHSYHNRTRAELSEKEKHTQLLQNFEKNSKDNLFASILYFKAKVSKIRNKDYLSVIS
jgi:hypothetical protein